MNKNLLLIGGGHAHMDLLANIGNIKSRGHNVTVIAPSEYHYYSGMGPGMLGETYSPDDIRFATKHVVEKQGGSFVLDSAVKILPEEKSVLLKSGKSVLYDVLSCNAGSYISKQLVNENPDQVYTVKPIEKLMVLQSEIIRLSAIGEFKIGIVGGGPSSVEISGNILQLVKKNNGIIPKIHIFSGSSFMPGFPEKIRKMALSLMHKRGIEISEGDYVNEVTPESITLKSGEKEEFSMVILATGVKPSELFADSGLPTGRDGGLLVNKYLQCTEYPDIFGGGDCIYYKEEPLNKVGVYAVRQNPVILHNVLARLEGKNLIPFDTGGNYLLIFNMGGNKGILHKSWITFGGTMAFVLKDYIDRKFMKKYQSLE